MAKKKKKVEAELELGVEAPQGDEAEAPQDAETEVQDEASESLPAEWQLEEEKPVSQPAVHDDVPGKYKKFQKGN